MPGLQEAVAGLIADGSLVEDRGRWVLAEARRVELRRAFLLLDPSAAAAVVRAARRWHDAYGRPGVTRAAGTDAAVSALR